MCGGGKVRTHCPRLTLIDPWGLEPLTSLPNLALAGANFLRLRFSYFGKVSDWYVCVCVRVCVVCVVSSVCLHQCVRMCVLYVCVVCVVCVCGVRVLSVCCVCACVCACVVRACCLCVVWCMCVCVRVCVLRHMNQSNRCDVPPANRLAQQQSARRTQRQKGV